jgi:hypothetical protein
MSPTQIEESSVGDILKFSFTSTYHTKKLTLFQQSCELLVGIYINSIKSALMMIDKTENGNHNLTFWIAQMKKTEVVAKSRPPVDIKYQIQSSFLHVTSSH